MRRNPRERQADGVRPPHVAPKEPTISTRPSAGITDDAERDEYVSKEEAVAAVEQRAATLSEKIIKLVEKRANETGGRLRRVELDRHLDAMETAAKWIPVTARLTEDDLVIMENGANALSRGKGPVAMALSRRRNGAVRLWIEHGDRAETLSHCMETTKAAC